MSFPTERSAFARLAFAICVSTLLAPALQAEEADTCVAGDIIPIAYEAADAVEWNTLSGLTADPNDPTRLYAVADHDSGSPHIFQIEVKDNAAKIKHAIAIKGPGVDKLDIEGIAAKRNGGFWVVSEGTEERPNLLIEVGSDGTYEKPVPLEESIDSRTAKKGLEGVALAEGGDGTTVYVALQEPLAGDTDGHTRIGRYDPKSKTWSYYLYPLQSEKSGVSELLHVDGKRFAAIERDGEKGDDAKIKLVTAFDLADAEGELPVAKNKKTARDLIAFYAEQGCDVEKQIEGLATAADGTVYAVVDRDRKPETTLLRLGRAKDLFPH